MAIHNLKPTALKTIFLLLLVVPLFATSQSQQKSPDIDSVSIYQKEIGKIWHTTYDSLQHSERLLKLRSNIVRLLQKSKDYSGPVLFTEIVRSDNDGFNKVLNDSSFSRLRPNAVRFGFGTSHKRGNAMYDIYFGIVGTDNQSNKKNETIATNYSSLLQLNFGIDFINSERLSLYPYGGVSIHSSNLKYLKSDSLNRDYTFLSNIHSDKNKTVLISTRLAYQYGVGFDFSFDYNKDRTFKTIAFVKVGVDKPFKPNNYKTDGVSYKPNIKQGTGVISFGIKFATKR